MSAKRYREILALGEPLTATQRRKECRGHEHADAAQLPRLASPSLWMARIATTQVRSGRAMMRPLRFALSTASCLLCMPYAVFLGLRLLISEAVALRGARPAVRLGVVASVVLLFGYVSGARDDLFITGQDFEVAGDLPPASCRTEDVVLCPRYHGATVLSLLWNNHSQVSALGTRCRSGRI